MKWGTKRNIERVLGEIGEVVGKYREHKGEGEKNCIGDNTDFELHLWNGVHSATPTVWLWGDDILKSTTNTIGQGIREIIAKMYEDMCCYPKHKCPTCGKMHKGYDLSGLPVEAFEELMQEAVEIAAAMNPGKTEVKAGRYCGPTVSFEINLRFGRAQLYFAEVQERFAINEMPCLFFESTKGLCIVQAIEDVLTQARKHLETHKPHICPVCGCVCG